MFFLILNLAGTLLHGYCAWRIGTLPWLQQHLGSGRWWLLVLVLWLAYVVGAAVGDHPATRLSGLLAQFSFHWLVILFLLSICLLTVDLLTGFGLWGRDIVMPLRAAAVLAAITLVTIALVQGLRAPVVTRYDVALPGLPRALDGTRIVAMSDLHLGAALGGEWMAARVTQVEALRPDLIVLVGDLAEGGPQADPALGDVLRRLRAPLGVWAVTGNHEHYGDTRADIALFEAAGIHWLRDRAVSVAPGLRLAGVDYGAEPKLLAALAGHDAGAAILLSHAPAQVAAAEQAGFGLMLSGHTHGGQVWPFGYLVRSRYPYLAGYFRVGRLQLIVGRGTGTWGARMRLWQPGEIVEVTLHAPA